MICVCVCDVRSIVRYRVRERESRWARKPLSNSSYIRLWNGKHMGKRISALHIFAAVVESNAISLSSLLPYAKLCIFFLPIFFGVTVLLLFVIYRHAVIIINFFTLFPIRAPSSSLFTHTDTLTSYDRVLRALVVIVFLFVLICVLHTLWAICEWFFIFVWYIQFSLVFIPHHLASTTLPTLPTLPRSQSLHKVHECRIKYYCWTELCMYLYIWYSALYMRALFNFSWARQFASATHANNNLVSNVWLFKEYISYALKSIVIKETAFPSWFQIGKICIWTDRKIYCSN